MMQIPRPFAIAIDDLGWMEGENEGYLGKGPYRVGIKRKMDIEDYIAVVDLAKKVGVRLQGLFILGELDRENIVCKVPTIFPSSMLRKSRKSELQLTVMDYVKENAAHLEFGFHGIGHEYWPDDTGFFKRAEWYNLEDKKPWSEQSIRKHIDCFVKIMAQYELDTTHHQSFPETFVPCAYSYYWNPYPKANEYSLGAIFQAYGTRYANTDFAKIPECNPPIDGAFDQGLHVLNRFNYGNLWYMIGQTPTIPIDYQSTDFIETHWPNLLSQDTFLQQEVTQNWINYYQKVSQHPTRYCSKNTAQHHSQFLYHKYASIKASNGAILIDNTTMPTDEAHRQIVQNLVLKLPITNDEHLNNIQLNGQPIPAYFETNGYAYLFIPPLSNQRYELTYTVGKNLPEDIVWHDSTCNILHLSIEENRIYITVRFYGTQSIQFLSKQAIQSVNCEHPLLNIEAWNRNEQGVNITCTAIDIQGVTASLCLQF